MDQDELAPKKDETLSLIPSADLIAELGRRYDTLIVVGIKELRPQVRSRMLRWKGDPMVAVAACAMVQHQVEQWIQSKEGLLADDVPRD